MPPKAETSDSSSEDDDFSRFASVAVSSAQLEQQAEASKQVGELNCSVHAAQVYLADTRWSHLATWVCAR